MRHSTKSGAHPDAAKLSETLDQAQAGACAYFIDLAFEDNGLFPDTDREGSPASIAAVGFGLTVLAIAVERKLMDRSVAVTRTLRALRFFMASEQSDQATATGFKGFYYHFLERTTGRRAWTCELSVIDTAILMAGVLFAGAYYDGSSTDEREIQQLSARLFERVDWRWATSSGKALSHGWTPESGFIHYGWEGYSEASMLYLMALGAPRYPIDASAYAAWAETYQWENLYGIDFLYAGPLFIHQFSHAWVDYRSVRDEFMTQKRADYFENTRRAVAVQREYALRNHYDFLGYGKHLWGITAGEGPGFQTQCQDGLTRNFFGYVARAVPYGPDDGTISPAGIAACLPFAPEIVEETIASLQVNHPEAWGKYGLKGSINPTYKQANSVEPWSLDTFYALDTGILAVMIENHRSQLCWTVTKRIPAFVNGLKKAGFRGGWLSDTKL